MVIIKKWLTIVLLIILPILSFFTYNLYKQNIRLQENLSVAITNEKAYISENSSLKEESRVFKFTVDQLTYYNDSLTQSMEKVRKELKIKDKNIKQMQYLLSEASKRDTIVFRDTIFTNSVSIDTIVGDKWYNLKLRLRYPSTVISNPTFVSEKYIMVSMRKETIDPPKKNWLLRLFQKKHRVAEVEVVEKNPYINSEKQRFIEIIN